MARRILVEIIGDASSLQRSFAKAEASTVAFSGTLSAQNRHLLQFSRGALVGSGALAGLTRAVVFASSSFVGAYGLAFALKTSADAAKEFQSQMELVTTQAGGTQREVEKMSKAILNIAPAVGQTPTELAKGLYHLESAGIRGSAAMRALTAAAKGAAVGHADLEDTVNALVGAYKSGITGVGSYTHAVATLSSVVGAGNIRMNDLNAALGTGILPAARAFGLTFQDVGAALATLSIGSVPVQEAATRLRMSFSLLSAGSVKADKALGTIGLTTRKLAVDMREGGLPQAIGDLKDHLAHLSPVDQVRTLQKAFGGGRFATSIITLVQNFDLLKQRLSQVDEGVAKFGASWERTQHTADFASRKFHAATQLVAVELGAHLLPSVTKLETRFAVWIDKMNKTGKLQKDIKEGAHDVSIVVHGLGVVFHAAEKPIVSFTEALGGVGKALRDLAILFTVLKLQTNFGLLTKAGEKLSIASAATKAQMAMAPVPIVVPNQMSRAGTTVYGPTGPRILGGAEEARSQEALYAASVRSSTDTAAVLLAAFAKELDRQSATEGVKALATGTEQRMAAIERMQTTSPVYGGGIGLRTAGGELPSGRMVPGGRFAGTVTPGISTGGEPFLLAKKSMAAASALDKVGVAAKGLGKAFMGLGSWAARNSTMVGLGLAFLGPQIAEKAGLGKGFGSVLGGTGFGLLAGGLLPGKYSAGYGAAIGAGLALHNQGGQLGRTGGDILSGAGTGAMIGSAFGPEGTLPGAVIGGLVGAFASLRHHTESASAALERLSKSVPSAKAAVQQAKTGLAEAKEQLAKDKYTRDQAKATLDQARATAIATRGHKDHKIAVDALHAAEAQYAGSLRQVAMDTKAIDTAQGKLRHTQQRLITKNKQVVDSFVKVADSVKAKFASPTIIDLEQGFSGGIAERIKKFDQAMTDLAKHSGPRMKRVAEFLKEIADRTHRIPSKKEIRIIVRYVMTGQGRLPKWLVGGPSPEDIHPGIHSSPPPATKAPGPKPPKPPPPHDFALPQSILLEEAKASTEGRKQQLKAARDELRYVKAQIASGKLTKKGLIDAYNEEAQIQGQIASLQKQEQQKKKKKSASLTDILPSSFTSQIERASAQVSVAQAGSAPAAQVAALEKLGMAYEKALKYLKSEHETGAKRLLQIKEEAALTGKIADVRKQIGTLISQAMDAARQSLGQLFQGPVMSPTQAQQNAMLGVPSAGPGILTKDLRAQTKQFARFEHDLQILRKRGASKELIAELQAQGPAILPYVEALAKGSKANLDAFLKAFAAREKLVRHVAKVELQAGVVNLKAAHVTVVSARHNHPGSVRSHRTPHMGEGGIVDKATLALIGEKGPEAVVPLPKGMRFDLPNLGQEAVVGLLMKIEHTLVRILATLKRASLGGADGLGGTIALPNMGVGGVPAVRATFIGHHRVEPILHARPSDHGPREFVINLDGRLVGRGILPHHQRQSQGGAAQVRGRHYGHNLALT